MQNQIKKLYNPLHLYIKRRVSNQLDAEDLTQEVFYKLAKSNNDEIKNIKSWIYTIAKNTITDYYRKKKVHTEEVDNISIDQEKLKNDEIDELSKCVIPFINQLPKEYRLIMLLSEMEGISQKEIAGRLDLNYVTVRSKVQRGRKKLRELLSDCCTIIQGGKGSILGYQSKEGCNDNSTCSS